LRRNIFIGLAALSALALVVFVGWWLLEGRWVESTENAYVEADIAVIAPRVAGYVATVAAEDNMPVRVGDVLATLDDTDYRARAAAAEAEAAMGESAVGTAQATEAARAAAIAEARAALAAAEAQATRAEGEARRSERLLAEKWISRARYDIALADARAARATVSQARANLVSAEAQAGGARTERSGAAAGSRAAAAQARAARYDLDNTVIRAPVDGVVGNRSARVGQYVRAGQQLMVVVPVERSYVVANFKETQIARMQPGQPVEIGIDAYPDVALRGRILSLSPASGSRFSILPPENATGNFTKIVQRIPIKIAVERPLPTGVRLVPGMSVEARIDIRSKPE
jgi:membrane fusion protein (multidrug efflux system)